MVYHQKKYQQHEADKRSLALHRCIADKVIAQPELVQQALDTLNERYNQRLSAMAPI